MKNLSLVILSSLLSIIVSVNLSAQTVEYLKGLDYNVFTKVPPPDIYTYRNILGKTQVSTFDVEFIDFPSEAETAFQKAIDIWSYLIISYNPAIDIKVKATWESLEEGVLAHAKPYKFFSSIGSNPDVYYPVALANEIEGEDLDPDNPDIEVSVNNNVSWYYGTDGDTPADTYDLVSVILHEMAHGLGYTPSFNVDENTQMGYFGEEQTTFPNIYDTFIGDGGISLTTYTNPSYFLYTKLIGNSLGFLGVQSISLNGNEYPKIYAPNPWEGGSSISHFDASYYPPGDPNSLMTAGLAMAEAIHSPGNVGLAVLKDLEWNVSNLITVTVPDKYTYWTKGNIYGIKWTANFGGVVNIELHEKLANGSTQLFQTLQEDYGCFLGVNSYYWNIPMSIPNGEYKIIIKNNNEYGESVGFFFITDLNQVAAPQFTPSSGIYAGQIIVRATCPDPDAIIRYTFGYDPNNLPPDPDENSSRWDWNPGTGNGFTFSFATSPDVIFKARTYRDGFDPSNIVMSIYQLEQGIYLKQLDAAGVPFGQSAYWSSSDWNYVNPDEPVSLELGNNNFLSTQEFKPNSYQKFNYWEDNLDNRRYRNWDILTIESTTTDVYSYFLPSTNGVIRIKNSLESTDLSTGIVEFKDPWLVDFDEPPYGLRSRGMDAPFKQRSSPFRPNYWTNYNGDIYKGVFKNQSGPGSNWEPPYYSVGMPTEQTISIYNQNRKFFPYKWTGGDVHFRNIYSRQTGVVFTANTSDATAVLKGQLMSNDQNGISSNSQRKIVRTDNGRYHAVYESMGTVILPQKSRN